MLKGTNVFYGERDIKDSGALQSHNGKNYYTSRPIGFISFLYRMKCAWKVASGNADIVMWQEHLTDGSECWCNPEVIKVSDK